MKQSETISKLLVALLGFQGEVDAIAKDTNNTFFKSKYADLGSILKVIDPILHKHGLVIMQHPTGEHGLSTILAHAESGEYFESEYDMKPQKDDPQGNGGRITYQRRYAITSILKLNTDEDDDGNTASQKSNEKPKEKYSKEDDNRPWMSEEALQGAIDSIDNGNNPKKIYEMADKKYRMKKEYRNTLKQYLEDGDNGDLSNMPF